MNLHYFLLLKKSVFDLQNAFKWRRAIRPCCFYNLTNQQQNVLTYTLGSELCTVNCRKFGLFCPKRKNHLELPAIIVTELPLSVMPLLPYNK